MKWRDIHRVAKTAGWSVDQQVNDVWFLELAGDGEVHVECRGLSKKNTDSVLRALSEAALGMLT